MAVFVMYTSHDFINHKVTGGTRRFLELLYGLLDKGDEVHLFIPKTARLKDYPNLIRYNVDLSHSLYIPKGIANFIINKGRLQKKIREITYDALIAVDVPYVFQLGLLRIPKLVFIVWQDFVEYRLLSLSKRNRFIDYVFGKVLTHLERISIKRSHKINVQCQYDLDVLCQRHPRLKERIIQKSFIVPNNVNTSWLVPLEISKQTPIADSKFTLCFIGNIDDRRKGLHILLEAVEILHQDGVEIKLNVIGDGHQLELLKKQYNYIQNVKFWGYNSEPYKILKESHLLIVPSLADSFPNTVLEALFFEIGVLGSKRGGIPEILLYDELLFEPDTKSLNEKIIQVMEVEYYNKVIQRVLERKKKLTFDWVEVMRQNILLKE